jgi:1-acyl-sn-glycerol-3-phosphate acyltransferase
LNYTFFDVPLLRTLLRICAVFYLKLTGWKREGQAPSHDKYVVIAAPHTSNWDFPICLAILLSFKIKPCWMGKSGMFRWPLGRFFRLLGGIPIDRSKSNNVVEQSIEAIKRRMKMVLVISPEGTRKKVAYWKTGFYHIAHSAKIPIALGFLDYGRKAGGFGQVFYTTGNIEADMRAIKKFYMRITAKYPEKSSLAILYNKSAA